MQIYPPSLTRAKPSFICASFRVLNSTSIARPTISRWFLLGLLCGIKFQHHLFRVSNFPFEPNLRMTTSSTYRKSRDFVLIWNCWVGDGKGRGESFGRRQNKESNIRETCKTSSCTTPCPKLFVVLYVKVNICIKSYPSYLFKASSNLFRPFRPPNTARHKTLGLSIANGLISGGKSETFSSQPFLL